MHLNSNATQCPTVGNVQQLEMSNYALWNFSEILYQHNVDGFCKWFYTQQTIQKGSAINCLHVLQRKSRSIELSYLRLCTGSISIA